jgi:hypothetical protein
MRVKLAEEPPTFEAKVREPGLRALAEMVGEKPSVHHKTAAGWLPRRPTAGTSVPNADAYHSSHACCMKR